MKIKTNSVICANTKTLLKEFRDTTIDLIITDLPYENLDKYREIGTTTRLKDKWFPTIKNEDFESIIKHFYRILKKDTHCYIFVDDETSDIIKNYCEKVGFTVWKRIVWDKVNIGMGYHYRAQYEFILFLEKGKRNLNDLSVPDVLSVKYMHDGYPTEKPIRLYDILMLNSSNKKQIVLDPFAGSGVLAESAIKNGRKYICVDLVQDACLGIEQRIKNITDKEENQNTLSDFM